MTKVLAIGSYSETDEALLKTEFATTTVPSVTSIADLSEECRSATQAVAFTGHAPLGGPEMDLLPNLRLIANYGVGYDAIDVAAASKRNISVTNTPDVLNDDVADLAVALLLAQRRELIEASEWVHSGNWTTNGNFRLAHKISGAKAGVVGLGRIGHEIASRLAAFKMDIHYTSRNPKQTPGWTFHKDALSLAKEVDYLFVALVGGPETENLVSREVLEALGTNGVLVNISRGSTVDEQALLEALETGSIAGAGLDVFQNEPKLNPRFLKLSNVVLLPHQGSATKETRAMMGQLQRDNIRAQLNNEQLLTPVN